MKTEWIIKSRNCHVKVKSSCKQDHAEIYMSALRNIFLPKYNFSWEKENSIPVILKDIHIHIK